MNNLIFLRSRREFFSDWHPLASGWLDGLAQEIQEIARFAQSFLINQSEIELFEALKLIKSWKKICPEMLDYDNTPDVVFDEELGNQLKPGAFIRFLMEHKSDIPTNPQTYASLALLKEISGLSELDIVCKKDTLSPAAQHLTHKIVHLYFAMQLLQMLDSNTLTEEGKASISANLMTIK